MEDVGEYGGEGAREYLIEFVGYGVGSCGLACREEVHGVAEVVCAYVRSTFGGCGREYLFAVVECV